MKTVYIGWEAGTLQNSQVQTAYGPSSEPLTLVGYQFDLGSRPASSPGLFGASPLADILFQASFLPSLPSKWAVGSDVAQAHLKQVGGTNVAGLHGPNAQDSVFAAAILKMWSAQSVNKSLIVNGLSILVPAGSYLVTQAAHSGFQADFEVQGVLFFG